MTQPQHVTSVQNSTNVRFPTWLRLGAQTLALLAPRRAEALAVRFFFTPRRFKSPAAPSPEGHRFVVEAGEHRLAAWEWGEGPTILLVHGWGGRAAQMSAFVTPLVDAGFHVVAFDQPAHGFSSGRRATVLDLANAVFTVSWKFRPVHGVVAHSLGATATSLALSRGACVERVAFFAPPAEPTYYARAVASALGLSPARTEGMLSRIREALGVSFDAVDLRNLAPRMLSQLLLIHDPEDREVPFAHGLVTARAWPSGRIERVRHLGHHRVLKDPDVIESVMRFMRARAESPGAALEKKPA